MSNSNLVQFRMKDETVEQTKRLQNKLNAPSKSDVIRRAIGLSDLLVNALESGDKLFIEGHGVRKEILIPGISNVGK